MHSRSREEIVISILEAATFPVNKTSIMCNARLSYKQLIWYFMFLQDKGLIPCDKKTRMWTVTGKGRDYMHACRVMREIIEPDPIAPVLR